MKFNISRTHARAIEARDIPTVGLETARIDARNRAWSSSAILLFRKTGSAASYRSFFGTHGRHVVPTVRLPKRRNSLRFPFVPVSLFLFESFHRRGPMGCLWDIPYSPGSFPIKPGFEPEPFPFRPERERKSKGRGGSMLRSQSTCCGVATHACFGPQRGSCATTRREKERHACVCARDLACGSTGPPHATEPEDGGGFVRRTRLGRGFEGACKLPIAAEWNRSQRSRFDPNTAKGRKR